MKRILFTSLAVLLLLSACSKPTQMLPPGYVEDTGDGYGIYEFTFLEESASGGTLSGWDFVYTYNGEEIQTGHRIRFALGTFSFHSITVEAVEQADPENVSGGVLSVAICHGGSGNTEIALTDSSGKTETCKITCNVSRVDREE